MQSELLGIWLGWVVHCRDRHYRCGVGVGVGGEAKKILSCLMKCFKCIGFTLRLASVQIYPLITHRAATLVSGADRKNRTTYSSFGLPEGSNTKYSSNHIFGTRNLLHQSGWVGKDALYLNHKTKGDIMHALLAFPSQRWPPFVCVVGRIASGKGVQSYGQVLPPSHFF